MYEKKQKLWTLFGDHIFPAGDWKKKKKIIRQLAPA